MDFFEMDFSEFFLSEYGEKIFNNITLQIKTESLKDYKGCTKNNIYLLEYIREVILWFGSVWIKPLRNTRSAAMSLPNARAFNIKLSTTITKTKSNGMIASF